MSHIPQVFVRTQLRHPHFVKSLEALVAVVDDFTDSVVVSLAGLFISQDNEIILSRFDEATEDLRAVGSVDGSDEALASCGLAFEGLYLLIE